MSLIQWNIRGLNANLEQIRILFKEHEVSVICLQETMLSDISSINLGHNFAFYKSPHLAGLRTQGGPGIGAGIIVKKCVNHRSIDVDSVLQACVIQIFTNRWITVCSLYLEYDLESRLRDNLGNPRQLKMEDLQSLIDQLPQPFILMGDFNAKHRLWGNTTCSRWGAIVEELLDNNDIILLNDGAQTRYDVIHNSESAIDLTLCSSSLGPDYQWSVGEDLHGSDHWPIHVKFLRNSPSPCLPKWKAGEADWKTFQDSTKIDRTIEDFPSHSAAYEYLVSTLICGAMSSIPRTGGNPRRPLVPWWTDACATSRKIARACYKRYRRRPIMVNLVIYKRAVAKQKRTFKEARRESFIIYISQLKCDSALSMVWKRIRKLMGKFVPSPLPILKISGIIISDPQEVAEVFGRHFANISSALHYPPHFRNVRENTTIVPPDNRNSEAYNLPFTRNELEYAISLSSPTSPGEDEILYSMVSHLPSCSKDFFLNVLNEYWFSGSSPKTWKTSVIIGILKPGKDSSLPNSYRPIALTSCVGKIYERMINTRLVWFLESRNVLSNRQFGFRKNRSTLDPLLFLTREIQNAFAVQGQAIGVFFDLEKAYDTTWRGGILKQLVDWGVGGNMFFAIKDFLSDRFLKVRVGSAFSSAFPQEEGIPQGSVLSPTLFNIAINGLLEQVPVGVHGLAYADDFAIVCSRSSALEAGLKIQSAINLATTWARSRGFKFSPGKTKAIRFCRLRRREVIPTLTLEGSILPYEDCVKYLGMVLDQKLTFKPHITELLCNVKQRLNILKVVSHFNWGADRITLLRMYQALVLSKIDYGCQIYGGACKTTLKKLDVAHNMALRICTGAYRTSPIDSLYVDSGIPPLFLRRQELGLRCLSKILTSKSNPNFKFVREPVDRAPTRPTLSKPLEVRLADGAREVGLIPPCVEEVCQTKYPPWCRPLIAVCPVLGAKMSCSATELKIKFLEHLSVHSDAISVFTDGSKCLEGVGCAVITPQTSIKKRLPHKLSVLSAELLAVLYALISIFNNPVSPKFVIHTDSMSVLSSLRSFCSVNPIVCQIQDWLVLLANRRKVKVQFCWVPSHVGVQGNELADAAAKAAARLAHVSRVNIPPLDLRNYIRRYSLDQWQLYWSSLNSNFKLKSLRPSVFPWNSFQGDRRSSIVLTRLRVGHTFLTHSYLMASGAERQAPLCPTCHEVISVKHFLIDCPMYGPARRNNFLVGLSMSEILGEDAPVERLFNFLRDIGLFYDI